MSFGSQAGPPAVPAGAPARRTATRVLVVLTLVAGTTYLGWRWLYSVNWHNWWIAVPLVLAETYALLDCALFGLTAWRLKVRGTAPPPPEDATVDVFITTYNEPVEMVAATATAARNIHFPHKTWILDDGDRPDMRSAAERIGVGYLTRGTHWQNRPRHAKAGNLNNALFQTDGEFMLILDADQIPDPKILDRMLGWFSDPKVALVQSPQWFSNVTDSDPLGSQAPLFYGPIQQGKDGWNAAFFCGSNALLRREALMQLGIIGYVRDTERAVRQALQASARILDRSSRSLRNADPRTQQLLPQLRDAVRAAQGRLDAGEPVATITYDFQQTLGRLSRHTVDEDLAAIRADLDALGHLPIQTDEQIGLPVVDEVALRRLADRDWSPLGALESVTQLMNAVGVERGEEAQPIMPLATVSVTEDMATSMRLHAAGWRSVFHHEVLARGLAPEDLRTMLQQRLRWAQGTLQVMLRENPLTQKGLAWGQRLMYFATMWSYLGGFAALPLLLAPVFYLCLGTLPVQAFGLTFLGLFAPYFLLNQALFWTFGYGYRTWRGQQYSLALFPVWIRAVVTAVGNVYFGRSLGFVVTPKTRPGSRAPFPWRLIWPQLAVFVLFAIAIVLGLVRLLSGTDATYIGTFINVAWVGYDVAVMSVIIQAALYQPPTTPPEPTDRPAEEMNP